MKTGLFCNQRLQRVLRRTGHAAAAVAATLLTLTAAEAQVSQTPLYLGGGNVPGNLVLTPSVEWPTINSVANLGAYDQDREYAGYFDANKCYGYEHDSDSSLRHFYPIGAASNHRCSGAWSGNFMNWAATQTIDPFRRALTGGLRVRDTATETWLEKARHDGQGGTNIYPNLRVPASGNNSTLVSGATPFNASFIRMRIQGLGNEMRFRLNDENPDEDVQSYDPDDDDDDDDDGDGRDGGSDGDLDDNAYRVSVRVKVCVPGMVEANCRPYAQGWKPEGLIQQYAEDLRIGIFGYLNDPDMLRDGGVLRARQKFVGQNMIVPGVQGKVANPNKEWDPVTGVLYQNPNSSDAADTQAAIGVTIANSGVINYLNKFGQLTNNNHKSIDPVSELYYTALRYLRKQDNVPEYTAIPGHTSVNATRAADGFPVILNWDDPVQYACQKNVVLGIGDVYTHRDKDLPGNGTYMTEEPTKPALVSGDDTIDVLEWTNRVGALEGLGNIANTNSWSGRSNSAYLAGLAYYANTTDIRPAANDFAGSQTVSTYWVDVREAQTLEPPQRNQYYLATKYGGFDVPEDFDPFADGLQLDWWHTNGETLVSFGPVATNAGVAGISFQRPDNYFVAGEAHRIIEGLSEAFAKIFAEVRSSAASVAANSTRVDTDTAVFQAAFDSRRWSGELKAFRIGSDGTIAVTPSWNAALELDALTDAALTNRTILTIAPPVAATAGSFVSTTGATFDWASLGTAQQDALRKTPNNGPLVTATVGQERLAYLRGSRVQEIPNGPYRQRDGRLGDIVNSDPQFVHKQDFGYALLAQSGKFTAAIASAYRTFRQSSAYQNRRPLVVVGSNDGMLHGFDAGLEPGLGGTELFAFVPHAAYENLYELTLTPYAHRYFVDGTPRVADAYLGASLGWRTIVVGVTGAGGESVFALDVTDPSAMNASKVLWEFTHPDLGNTLGQPAVAPLPSGEFGVVVTSGYTGTTTGKIWILNPANGTVIRTIDVPNSGDLGAPLLADLDADRVADRLYVGDSRGNVWRFDLVGNNPAAWAPPAGLVSGGNPLPLFVARDASNVRQAITAPLASAFNNNGQHMLFVGTGAFFRVDDNVVPATPQVESFYGLIDSGTPISGRGELREQEILTEQLQNGMRVRAVTANTMLATHKGWYLDLLWKGTYGGPGAKGERSVSRAIVRSDRVIFTTLIPNPDPCSFGGESWLIELNAFTGSRLSYAVFDLDVDNDFDMQDWITVALPDGTTIVVPPSAVAPDIGIIDTPAVITDDTGDENKVLSGSSGALIRVRERGGIDIGRQSWRQLR